MNNLLNIILNDTFTQTGLKHAMLILRAYLSQKIFGSRAQFAPNDLNWLNTLPENFYQQFNSQNTYQLLEELTRETQKITPLVLYLAFEADESTAAQICSFARQTFQKPDLILDIKVNPLLIAGCSLSWKGIYKDYSLKAKIDERKEDLMVSFKKFLQ